MHTCVLGVVPSVSIFVHLRGVVPEERLHCLQPLGPQFVTVASGLIFLDAYTSAYGDELWARLINPLVAPGSVTAAATATTTVSISWPAVKGASKYQVARSSDGTTFTTLATIDGRLFLNDGTAEADTAYLYKIRALDAGDGPGPYSPVDLATTVLFTDDPISTGSTIVKAAHVAQLRTAVNAVRRLAGIGDASFSDPALVAGSTRIRAQHVLDLRAALDAARNTLVLSALTYTDPSLASATIKAAHFTDLREGVK